MLTFALNWYQSLARKKLSPQAELPAPPPGPRPLRRIVQVFGKVNGMGEDLRLMVDSAGPDTLAIQTWENLDLGEGDALQVRLLTGVDGGLSIPATVAWLLRAERGFRGELRLRLAPEQQSTFREFLQRESRP